MNEFEVIRRISTLLPPAPPEVLVPLGDDCAVLAVGDSTWVAASDMLVSGHHFEDWATPEDVGYKAVAVNASEAGTIGKNSPILKRFAESLRLLQTAATGIRFQ